MSRASWPLVGIAVGAIAIALLAVHGKRRRALIRARFPSGRERRSIPDDRLVRRVRAALGRFTTHPKSIHVAAGRGRVTLRGAVLAGERADLVAAVRHVDGVEAVNDRLTTYLDSIGVPELQGGEPSA
jgi:osmotically-inducible protein OsmY